MLSGVVNLSNVLVEDWRHKSRKYNVEQVSQFFVIEKTIIILKMEKFCKNNRSFLK